MACEETCQLKPPSVLAVSREMQFHSPGAVEPHDLKLDLGFQAIDHAALAQFIGLRRLRDFGALAVARTAGVAR